MRRLDGAQFGPIGISVARDTFEFAGEETPTAAQVAFARGERGG
jgi:hypothetical protein